MQLKFRQGLVGAVFFLLLPLIVSGLSFNVAFARITEELPAAWAALHLPFQESTMQRLRQGETYAKASLEDAGKEQKRFSFAAAGWHAQDCATALPRLTAYENYHRYLPFVEQSTYQDATQTIDLLFKVWIIPFSLRLHFQIPRMKQAGSYPFTFKEGFLPDLKGTVKVQDVENRCLILITAHWQGKDPGFNPTLFEIFAQTAAMQAMEKMLRVTRQ